MSITISINGENINTLDISPVKNTLEPLLKETLLKKDQSNKQEKPEIKFEINYPREENDPRELSEIPEIRLWFLRLDSYYPWLPFWLDWKQELSRYTAMLVPHQFHRREGIQYNPEALEIFVMQKIFVIHDWLQQKGLEDSENLQAMALMLGYDLAEPFFDLLN